MCTPITWPGGRTGILRPACASSLRLSQGDANQLYHAVHDKLYALPDETRVFVGHDYQPNLRRATDVDGTPRA